MVQSSAKTRDQSVNAILVVMMIDGRAALVA